MKDTLGSQELRFFTQNGYLELELAKIELDAFCPINSAMISFIVKKLGKIALLLCRKKPLRLALVEWMDKEFQKLSSYQDLLPIQEPVICASLITKENEKKEEPNLGLSPAPREKDNILFFKPELLLDFSKNDAPLLLITFSTETTLFFDNPNAPSTKYFKSQGYYYGDELKNKDHPLIF